MPGHARSYFFLDVDGLLIVIEDPDFVKGYKNCIVTPNVVEFGRLAKALGIDVTSPAEAAKSEGSNAVEKESETCERLLQALGSVTIIQKGPHNVISNGVTSIMSDIKGDLKRSGYRGDTLTRKGNFLSLRLYHHRGSDRGSSRN